MRLRPRRQVRHDRVGEQGDAHRVVLPSKNETYNTIEGMIRHFKLVVDGIPVPAGEAYAYSEGGNGELGFYVVSDGSGVPG